MSLFLSGANATATATARDLLRRPGVLLAALAVAVLLLLLPDVCARAVDESANLALQVGASTIVLYLTLLAGFAGLRAGASDGDLGATVEWRTPPLRPGAYVSGRFAGVLAACLILFVALVAFLAAGEIEELREHPPDVAATVLVCAGGLLTAAQFAALGIMLACLTTRQFAAILFAATLVATRTVVPELASHHGVSAALAALLPDPTRLDLTREFAFHRPVDGLATTAAIGCSALQSAACLCVAEWALRRRET